jgi:hypothetical protein
MFSEWNDEDGFAGDKSLYAVKFLLLELIQDVVSIEPQHLSPAGAKVMIISSPFETIVASS